MAKTKLFASIIVNSPSGRCAALGASTFRKLNSGFTDEHKYNWQNNQ
jgi:hypothetical protein